MENTAGMFGLQINEEKTKLMIVGRKNCLYKNAMEHLKINYYKFEKVENLNIKQLNLIKVTITKQTCKKE